MKSRLHLPKLDSPPDTILDYLIAHFPQIPADVWHERAERGLLAIDDGSPVTLNSSYRHGITVLYSKQVRNEPPAGEVETIVFQDDHILVADKPHGMVVTPAGDQVDRALLTRLQHSTGMSTLTPMHRLDRDTAGVVLFAFHTKTRSRYHALFSEGTIRREYLAIAHLENKTDQRQWIVRNTIEEGEPWFRQRIAEGAGGEVNAITRIERLESRSDIGLFRLLPESGKKHQLRVHMASLGFPIVGDPLYPNFREKQAGDPPLQLLAHRLSFVDPLSGEPREFTSTRKLRWPLLGTVE
ncbi:MAG TPA: pseudouridine synthase [Terriglobia bacterium]|nr:pseudouridine synthase [Terriglobia bacterium]